MKKNKNSIFENMKLSKERRGILIVNIISFLLIFIALETIMAVAININFYYDIDKSLEGYVENIHENIREEITIGTSGTRIVQTDRGKLDGRIMVIAYKEVEGNKLEINVCNYQIFYHLMPSLEVYNPAILDNPEEIERMKEELKEVQDNDIFKITSASNKVYTEEAKDSSGNPCYFRTIVAEVNERNLPNIRYVKVMTVINSELKAQRSITQISITCSAVMFFLSIFASILVTAKVLRPLKESLDKQLAFVSDASHELRTPLAIVQSKLDNILTKSDSTVYEVSDDIAVSLKEVSRLNKLTNELLMLARDDNNTLAINLETVNLEKLILETSEPFTEIGEISGKKFHFNVMPIDVNVDYNLIKQVLIILLDNALRYTNENDEITISTLVQSSMVIIEVADTGIGISDEGKKHLFERFYREDKARSRETGGNGLGLSIAWSIIKKHRGDIYAIDNQPKGTRFIIELPKNKK